MNTYKLIVIDDEEPARRLAENFASRIPSLELVNSFASASTALEFLQNNEVDIVLADISMQGINGIEFARIKPGKSKIVFATAHEKYALEGFNLSAIDYLLKPYSFDRFSQALEKTINQIKMETAFQEKDAVIYCKINYSNYPVYLSQILFIESINNNLVIHLENGEQLSFRESLKSIIVQLPADQFIRIHRSYIVHLNKVTHYSRNKVVLAGHEFPVSDNYRSHFLQVAGKNAQ